MADILCRYESTRPARRYSQKLGTRRGQRCGRIRVGAAYGLTHTFLRKEIMSDLCSGRPGCDSCMVCFIGGPNDIGTGQDASAALHLWLCIVASAKASHVQVCAAKPTASEATNLPCTRILRHRTCWHVCSDQQGRPRPTCLTVASRQVADVSTQLSC